MRKAGLFSHRGLIARHAVSSPSVKVTRTLGRLQMVKISKRPIGLKTDANGAYMGHLLLITSGAMERKASGLAPVS